MAVSTSYRNAIYGNDFFFSCNWRVDIFVGVLSTSTVVGLHVLITDLTNNEKEGPLVHDLPITKKKQRTLRCVAAGYCADKKCKWRVYALNCACVSPPHWTARRSFHIRIRRELRICVRAAHKYDCIVFVTTSLMWWQVIYSTCCTDRHAEMRCCLLTVCTVLLYYVWAAYVPVTLLNN